MLMNMALVSAAGSAAALYLLGVPLQDPSGRMPLAFASGAVAAVHYFLPGQVAEINGATMAGVASGLAAAGGLVLAGAGVNQGLLVAAAAAAVGAYVALMAKHRFMPFQPISAARKYR